MHPKSVLNRIKRWWIIIFIIIVTCGEWIKEMCYKVHFIFSSMYCDIPWRLSTHDSFVRVLICSDNLKFLVESRRHEWIRYQLSAWMSVYSAASSLHMVRLLQWTRYSRRIRSDRIKWLTSNTYAAISSFMILKATSEKQHCIFSTNSEYYM